MAFLLSCHPHRKTIQTTLKSVNSISEQLVSRNLSTFQTNPLQRLETTSLRRLSSNTWSRHRHPGNSSLPRLLVPQLRMTSSCCPGPSSTNGNAKDVANGTKEDVKEYYGKILQTSKDLKTSACTTAGAPPLIIRDALRKLPDEVLSKYYGCGSPLPTGGMEGLTVLDLGSGSGRDCYVMSQLVGEAGKVVGIDMTDEQLSVARNHADEYCKSLGYSRTNMEFKKGYIEDIKTTGVADGSVNLVISNCVVNLSPDKPAVIKGVYDSLAEGGEFYFSDVYCDRRLPEDVRTHKVLWGECIAGALYIEDFKRICNSVGFSDVRKLSMSKIEVTDPELKEIVGEAKFYSITYRCFKIASLETLCEDYGQVAYYKGTIPGSKSSYELDDHHLFEANRPLLVCGNSASMVGESWLGKHFKIVGDRSTHFGLFQGCYTDWSDQEADKGTENAGMQAGCC